MNKQSAMDEWLDKWDAEIVRDAYKLDEEPENKIEKKKQSFPEIPEVEVYVKFHELKRVIKEVERGAKDCVMTKEKDGIDFTPDMENSEAKVKATIGFHHLLPHMEAIINYMKKKKKYDEEN